MNSTVKTLLIVAVVVGGGVAAYMYWKKKNQTTPVVAVTNGNPNTSAGSGLAANINAAAGAANTIGNLAQSFGFGASTGGV